MKAVRLQAYGDVDQLRYEDAPDPVPGADEALVKIAVSGLNPVDLIVRKGLFAQVAPLQFPAILGVDAAGTIVAVGAGVTEFAVGDRVVAHLHLPHLFGGERRGGPRPAAKKCNGRGPARYLAAWHRWP